jgi:molybdopterin synthase sulfur carrier subunit
VAGEDVVAAASGRTPARPASYAPAVQVRVRLGAGLSRLSAAPLMTVDLADGATVEDLYARLRDAEPGLAPALRSALPIVGGEHVPRDRPLADRQDVALLLPISGG